MVGGLRAWIGLRRSLFALFFLLALAPRLLVFNIAIHRERTVYNYQDSWGYITPAQNLIEGNGFADDGGKPAFWWPPGYAGLLAIVFASGLSSPEHLAGALMVQVILSSMVAAMAALIALELVGARAALAAGILMVFEPSSLAYANLILAETLFTFLLLLAVLAWIRWWASAKPIGLITFAGLVGLLPLVRPVAAYLWAPLALLLVWFRPASAPRGRSLAMFVALATLPMAAWTLRNYSHLRVPVFATVGQFNEAVFARAVEDLAGEPRPAATFKQPWQDGFGRDQGLSFPQVVRARDGYFRKVLVKHPIAVLGRLTLTGAGILGVPDRRLPDLLLQDVPDYRGGSVRGRLAWLRRLGWLGGLLLLGMAVSVGGILSLPVLAWRARAWPRARQALLGLVALLTVYQLLISSFIMFQGERFRVPIIPLLAVTLACALLGSSPAASPKRNLEPPSRP